jgi:uncharacterized membrane protein HdeD (DUF308 family)
MRQLEMISDTVRHFYWTLLLQGFLFILLAVLILIYPQILFALAAAAFLVIGIVLLAFAMKVRAFWQKLPGFMK